ncbi:TIR domain-containing protein [Microbacterium sp. CFBP 8790]|uniref:TIR domain-containing protein n=1 Tax=unclassified Microbacterium TaxID=2609290 RepID=UPI00177F1E15|nr:MULTISPECIES: TIR domain-containing protein [unclassified Microbacterium]MBD8206878.1 TIR domain-containing protein [Microbacterium sp. CFBP 8801]MBD8508736.1 TIR domain-containing protein [Microbacterium sp. CFBP 8790]
MSRATELESREPRLLEEVFKVSGVPTHTFVPPSSYGLLKVALRTKGRGVVIEGPSGIGKSTAVERALAELGLSGQATMLSARKTGDVEYIAELPQITSPGIVVIDDFHRLDEATKSTIADLLKVSADAEDSSTKLIILGINDAGRALIESGSDVANRIESIRFESEDPKKIGEMIAAGEAALNVTISAKQNIVNSAQGSFYIAQLLAWNACIAANVTEELAENQVVDTSYAAVQREVVRKQKLRFGDAVRDFARGTRFRPGGRAPYLHVLRWLADSDSWSIHLPAEMRSHPSEKISVGIVLERGYLELLTNKPDVARLMHLDPDTQVLSVEDPMLIYYLRSITWGDFIKEVGFTKVDHTETYDVALTFAGEDRAYAEELYDALEDNGHAVFYDLAEQHRIIGEDVEAYLAPIYASGSRYVVAILGPMYGMKRWTLFESEQYKARLTSGHVLPIWSTTAMPTAFDENRNRGGLAFDPEGNLRTTAVEHASVISKKIAGL